MESERKDTAEATNNSKKRGLEEATGDCTPKRITEEMGSNANAVVSKSSPVDAAMAAAVTTTVPEASVDTQESCQTTVTTKNDDIVQEMANKCPRIETESHESKTATKLDDKEVSTNDTNDDNATKNKLATSTDPQLERTDTSAGGATTTADAASIPSRSGQAVEDASKTTASSGGGGGGSGNSSGVGCEIEYHWIGTGKADEDDPSKVYHAGIKLVSQGGQIITVRIGDTVRLWSTNLASGNSRSQEVWQAQWICRVKELWEVGSNTSIRRGGGGGEDQSSHSCNAVKFRGQWYYQEEEVRRYRGNWFAGVSREQLLQQMLTNELILTDQSEVNDISCIHSLVAVNFQDPSNPAPIAPQASGDKYNPWICRYKLRTKNGSWILDEWKQELDDVVTTSEVAVESLSSSSDDDDQSASEESDAGTSRSGEGDDADDDGEGDDKVRVIVAEGEGSSLRQNTQVGDMHQVPVPLWKGPQRPVRSRNPKKVWTPNQINEEMLQSFLQDLARKHNSFLKEHGLTSEEPYSPLPASLSEEFMRQQPDRPLTGSQVSTGAHLSHQPNALLKECDVDAILELLHDHNYNTQSALQAAQAQLEGLTTGWTPSDKALFEETLRMPTAGGSLRRMAKNVSNKTLQQVVDYWFRFKIPDQFRLYQNQKREQAIRVMEVIEKRRYHEITLCGPSSTSGSTLRGYAGAGRENVPLNGDNQSSHRHAQQHPHWSETSAGDVTGALVERRQVAKALMMDVQEIMGREVCAEVANAVRELSRSYDESVKNDMLALLQGHPSLQKRLMEFLPSRN